MLLLSNVAYAAFSMEDYQKEKAQKEALAKKSAAFSNDDYASEKKEDTSKTPDAFKSVEDKDADYSKGISVKKSKISSLQQSISTHTNTIKRLEGTSSEKSFQREKRSRLEYKKSIHQAQASKYNKQNQGKATTYSRKQWSYHSTLEKEFTASLKKLNTSDAKKNKKIKKLQKKIAYLNKQIRGLEQGVRLYEHKQRKKEMATPHKNTTLAVMQPAPKAVRPMPAQMPMSNSSNVMQQLASLKQLFDQKLISEEDYYRKKTEILKRL